MRQERRQRVLALSLFFLFFCFFPIAWAQESAGRPRKILLVHSYHAGYPWASAITQGVRLGLSGKKVALKIFYMDTKRKTEERWKIKAGEMARYVIDSWKPDVVISADDNAQIFVTQHYRDQKPFFVFCGVNGDPADYGFPATNVTGIVERPFFKKSLDYLRRVLGEERPIRKIGVLSGAEATSLGALTFLRQQKIPATILGYHLVDTFEVWKKRVHQYDFDADVLYVYLYHTLREKGHKDVMDPKAVMRWTVENSGIPVVGFFDFAIEDGALCGVVESGQEHGEKAARMAAALLDGIPIEKLPVEKAEAGLKMINLKTAKRLGIAISEEALRQADRVIQA